jgi:succinoglycan biosynthesis protein ExoA
MSSTFIRRPLVSVILSVYNESAHIEEVVLSILGQVRPTFDLELIVIDGNSTDGTREILQGIVESNPEVRLLVNARRVTPYSFNLGLEHARGEYICIFGAHTAYDPDYIGVCLSEMSAQDAVGCGGRVITTAANASLQARLVAAALGTAFGTSSKSFRNHPEGYADNVNYPVFVRNAVNEIGGYDEQLHRNQDIDLNQRLRARGHRLYMTWKTGCRYFVQPSVSALAKYGWKTGYWNVISLKKNPSAHSLYHFVPAIFVLAGLVTVFFSLAGWYLPAPYGHWSIAPLILLLVLYFGVTLLVSSSIAARQKWAAALLLPVVFFSLHTSYGAGTLWAFLRNAKSPELSEVRSGLEQANQVQGAK